VERGARKEKKGCVLSLNTTKKQVAALLHSRKRKEKEKKKATMEKHLSRTLKHQGEEERGRRGGLKMLLMRGREKLLYFCARREKKKKRSKLIQDTGGGVEGRKEGRRTSTWKIERTSNRQFSGKRKNIARKRKKEGKVTSPAKTQKGQRFRMGKEKGGGEIQGD